MAYYTIAIIAFLAIISPGPDFIIVSKNALVHNFRRAGMTAIGIATGTIIHSSYCILGLAIIISRSLLLFNLIKYLGATYLIYLGIKSLTNKKNNKKDQTTCISLNKKNDGSLWLGFREGLLTNVLNPKCTLLMLSVFTLVVKPYTPLFVQIIYASEITCITLVWFIFLSYTLTSKTVKTKIEKIQPIFEKIIGCVLITLGVTVILKTR